MVTSTFALAFTPDGRCVVGAGGDHKIYLWDLVENRRRALLDGQIKAIHDPAHPRRVDHTHGYTSLAIADRADRLARGAV